jgi:hypothetical protein
VLDTFFHGALVTVLLSKKSHNERLDPLGESLHCYSTSFDDEIVIDTVRIYIREELDM